MNIADIIAAAQTTSTPWTGELTNGTHEAILTFSTRKAADEIVKQLKAAGATATVNRTEYREWIVQAHFTL